MQDFKLGNFAHRRHQIIREGAGEKTAGLVGHEFLVKRRRDPLRKRPMHLAVGDERIEQRAGVMHRDIAIDPDLEGHRIDLDPAHIEHEAVGE